MGHTDALQYFFVAQTAEEFDDACITPQRIVQTADGNETMKGAGGKCLAKEFHLVFHLPDAAPHYVYPSAEQMYPWVFAE